MNVMKTCVCSILMKCCHMLDVFQDGGGALPDVPSVKDAPLQPKKFSAVRERPEPATGPTHTDGDATWKKICPKHRKETHKATI